MMNNYSNEFLVCKDCAFTIINRRRHTKKELIDKLIKKEYEATLAKEVAEYLEEAGYIDDYDYSRRFISDSIKLKKHGMERIRRDLLQKGVKSTVFEDVIFDMEFDTYSVLKELIESKANKLDFNDEKQLNKLLGFLLRRGFKYSEINKAVTEYRNEKENY